MKTGRTTHFISNIVQWWIALNAKYVVRCQCMNINTFGLFSSSFWLQIFRQNRDWHACIVIIFGLFTFFLNSVLINTIQFRCCRTTAETAIAYVLTLLPYTCAFVQTHTQAHPNKQTHTRIPNYVAEPRMFENVRDNSKCRTTTAEHTHQLQLPNQS